MCTRAGGIRNSRDRVGSWARGRLPNERDDPSDGRTALEVLERGGDVGEVDLAADDRTTVASGDEVEHISVDPVAERT